MSNIEYCILKSEEEIIEYEKGLYKAFVERDPNSWVSRNYEKIDNYRLRSKIIQYSDQDIFAAKYNKKIMAANSVNYNMTKKLQLEEMGFSYDGKEVMYSGITGKKLEARIYVANTYYLKLERMVKNHMINY